MDIHSFLQAMYLGILEGLTEFLPVSSTGHLILFVDLLGFKGPPGHVFEIVIQLGAIFAICWLYRKKIWEVTTGFFSKSEDRYFAYTILLGFLPAMVLGATLHDFIKRVLFSPMVVSVMLVVGGVIIIIIERMNIKPKYKSIESMPLRTAFYVGVAQCLAMIPGTSRSGATIMGALCLKVDRKTATEFSFFLAIPTMLGATVYDLYKNMAILSFDNSQVIIVGFIAAFISALLVVKQLIKFISTHGFMPFAYYRIVIGSVMLYLLLTQAVAS